MPTEQHHHTYQRALRQEPTDDGIVRRVPAGPLTCSCGKVYDADRIVDVAEVEQDDSDTPSTSRSWAAELQSVRAERDALSDECLRLTEAMGRYAEEQVAVEADRDRLAATIARVEAVVAAVEAVRPGYDWMVPASSLRAALDGPPGDRNFSELTGHPLLPLDTDGEAT